MSKEDKDILRVRLRFIDLVKSFFLSEPDAEKISRWRGTFSALSKERVNPLFDESVQNISAMLETKTLAELQQEFYALFVDPFSDDSLSTSASFYLDGRDHGNSLVELRELLMQEGIEKEDGVIETEDSLVVLLDILKMLIEENKDASLQQKILGGYLIPVSNRLSQECNTNKTAEFFSGCCSFLGGYLELERGLTGLVEQ